MSAGTSDSERRTWNPQSLWHLIRNQWAHDPDLEALAGYLDSHAADPKASARDPEPHEADPQATSLEPGVARRGPRSVVISGTASTFQCGTLAVVNVR